MPKKKNLKARLEERKNRTEPPNNLRLDCNGNLTCSDGQDIKTYLKNAKEELNELGIPMDEIIILDRDTYINLLNHIKELRMYCEIFNGSMG